MAGHGGRRNNAGRKPTPPSLALLRGNPGKRAIRETAVKPGAFAGAPPDWLGATARAWWHQHEDMYVRLGLLTELSAAAFALFADAWGDWIDLRIDLKRDPDAGVKRQAETFSRLRSLAIEFGIGPASLSRITAAGASGEADPVADYRAKRAGAA